MRSISVDLSNHLAQKNTTLATCWKITRRDNTSFYFTDHDKAITYSGDDYTPLNSGDPTSYKATDNLSVDNMDVQVILNSNDIDETDIRAGKFDYAEIWVFIINYEDTTMGILKLSYGTLGEVEIEEYTAKVEVRSLTQMAQQDIGEVISPDCNADLGDSRCAVGMTSHTFELQSVTSVDDNQIFYAIGLTAHTDDYFSYGIMTWTSGSNNGIEIEVKDWVQATGQFTLFAPMPYTIQIGDQFTVTAGCDRKWSTCQNTFSNSDNFRGFPHVPGTDHMMQYPEIK